VQRPLRRVTILAALMTFALACSPLRRGGEPVAVIYFDNQSLAQADVFAVAPSGNRVRIGTVFAGRREALRVSASALGGGNSVTIVARLLASSQTPTSGPITLLPGDRLEVRLPPDARTLIVLPARPQQP
jgi:hypothetical protein